MAVSGFRVDVTTTPTVLVDAGPGFSEGGTSVGAEVLIRNVGSQEIDVGGADVESGAGFAVPAGAAMNFPLEADEKAYAVATSGTVAVHVFTSGTNA